MPIKATATEIPDVLVIEPTIYADERGYFFESFNQSDFDTVVGRKYTFVQDNQSKSKKGVLRGLHFQLCQTQGKLIRVLSGSIYDVAVDLRKQSATYGQWVSRELSADNNRQLWIPEGFAHGFLTLTHEALVLYKTTDYYHPASERTLMWSDPDLNIQWPRLDCDYTITTKDQNGLTLKNIEGF